MGYKIVAVNPLKQFPLLSFGLTNVVSLDDAKGQIRARGIKARVAEIKTIAEIAMLEERWADGKIEPALKLHLARQKRRFAHFESACRFLGCDNPHRQKHGRGLERNTKAHRPMVKPLFCGVHVGLRKLLTEKQLAELHAASEKRVVAK